MNYPGYTLVRREDCPEQHGVLTVLNHDVSTRCWRAARSTP